jgi:hypothetical protein
MIAMCPTPGQELAQAAVLDGAASLPAARSARFYEQAPDTL